jgi:uncharacterized protein YpuA (DUF1002 family)
MAILTVPRVLREKLGEEGAEALVELLNTIGHQERDNLLVLVEERFARRVGEESAHLKGHVSEVKSVLEGQIREVEAKLENQIREVEAKLEKRITEVEAKLENQIREVEAKLEKRITEVEAKLEKRVGELESKFEVRLAQVRADLIRWMFIFWAGQIGVLVALLALFFRLLQG